MHMADALLSPPVGLAFVALSGGAIAYGSPKLATKSAISTPVSGVLAAFVFAAQMINFAIPGTGSSGHLGGGLLLAMVLGPWGGLMAMAAVLIVQALLFADGGLLALGANIFNLGVIPCLFGLWLLEQILKRTELSKPLAVGATAVVCLQLGALGVALQTALSGRAELPLLSFWAFMALIHLPIGIVEGFVTAQVAAFMEQRNLVVTDEASQPQLSGLMALGIGTILLGMVVAWGASTHPDGLEWSIAQTTGSEELHADSGLNDTLASIQDSTALLPDYGFPNGPETGWAAPNAGTSLSGLVGALVVAGVMIGAVALARKSRRSPDGSH